MYYLFNSASLFKKNIMKNILITGGAGFIGSHACVALASAGYNPIILDNLVNSNVDVINRLCKIIGFLPIFIKGDIRNKLLLDDIFSKYNIYSVMHFAGLKAVGESVVNPLKYYDNNIIGTLNLLAAMKKAFIKNIIFSSSATVYGDPISVPVKEDFLRTAINPYGRSKIIIEDMLEDIHKSDSEWRIARLRYFNPVGAHKSGLIGEDPVGIPNNLMPYIAQVAIGKLKRLKVFGVDYPTIDGSGVRDYIHVMDLADGHVAALNHLNINNEILTVNLGTGYGVSVLQMIKVFKRVSGREIPYDIVARRQGDVAQYFADVNLAKNKLNWVSSRTIDDMCADTWRWINK